RIDELKQGEDHTLEVEPEELKQASQLRYTHDAAELADANVYIVTVPTPIDEYKQPDLTHLVLAIETIAKVVKRGDVVSYESTVQPCATEDECVPVLEPVSGLRVIADFSATNSRERINSGNK